MRTLASLVLALLLQVQGGASPDGSPGEIVALIARSSRISKGVLLILLLLSIFTWSIFLFKWWMFQRAQRRTTQFLDVFRRSHKFSEVQSVCRSSLAGWYQIGVGRWNS